MRSFTDMWYDPVARKKILIFGGGGLAFIIVLIIIIVVATSGSKNENFYGSKVLNEVPLIDGYNDFANNLYLIERNVLANVNFTDLTKNEKWKNFENVSSHTDLERLKAGKVRGQFWAAYADCNTNGKDAVARTMEQIDVIRRLTDKYPNDMSFVTTADGIWQAFWDNKVGSLIGVSGGHSIDSRLAVLRNYYDLGVRYMTITNDCDTPWATSHLTNNTTHGLTTFGKNVILEMNRLGMIVDVSHASLQLITDVLNTTNTPVIFSHSAAAALTNITQNVNDDVIAKLKENKGIIMINFGSEYVRLSNTGNVTVADVIAHLDHIRNITDSTLFVGIGANYDGTNSVPEGLGDVSKYPDLFDELAMSKEGHAPWYRQDLRNLASENFFRVMKAVEQFRLDNLNNKDDPILLYEESIPPGDLGEQDFICRSDYVAPTTPPPNP